MLEFVDPVTHYANEVIAGRIIAGPHVRATCKRHIKDMKTGHKRGLYFDFESMWRVFRFFEKYLKLSEGQYEGQDFKLHISQKFILGSLFGWKRKDGTRRFRRCYIEMGKGNGKSPIAGGLGLYGMLSDNEPGAQIYSAGADRNQSDILFQDAVKMAKSSPKINAAMTYSGNQKVFNMACLRKKQANSFFRPLAKTAGKSGSGPRPHYALIDELHEHPDRAVMDLLERGFKWRRQPLLFIITNSGSDRNSVCFEEHEHAIRVAEGALQDDRTFSYVCALDKGDDPFEDPECWEKANPLMGVTITREYLAEQVEQAKMMPGKANGIKRLHFCIWTDSVEAWVTRETWMSLEDPNLSLNQFIGKECHAGLDLSSRKDLTAAVLTFRDGWTDPYTTTEGEQIPAKQKYAMFAFGYTPADTLQDRIKLDKAPYDVWVDQGHLTAVPGSVIDFTFIIHDLLKWKILFRLEAVAYDAFLITDLIKDLNEMNEELPLVEHPQGYGKRKDTDLWMPGSVDTLETLILEKRLRVHVNPALRSAVAGATFETSPADLKRFTKQKATQRIDLIVGGAMSIGSITAGEENTQSIYETDEYSTVQDAKQLAALKQHNNSEKSIYETTDYSTPPNREY